MSILSNSNTLNELIVNKIILKDQKLFVKELCECLDSSDYEIELESSNLLGQILKDNNNNNKNKNDEKNYSEFDEYNFLFEYGKSKVKQLSIGTYGWDQITLILEPLINLCAHLPQRIGIRLIKYYIFQIKIYLDAIIKNDSTMKNSFFLFYKKNSIVLKKFNFIEVENSNTDNNYIIFSDEEIESSLQFLYCLLVRESDKFESFLKLDIIELLFLLQGGKNSSISTNASKVLNVLLTDNLTNLDSDFSSYIWNQIHCLFNNEQPVIAYKLWLKWIGIPNISLDSQYKNIVETESYGKYIQQGLIGKSTEVKKYSLHILSLTIKSFDSSFSAKYFKWNQNQSQKYIKDWQKILTLIEIFGIDTALNQAKAALNDLPRFLDENSNIHYSWVYSILSLGLDASIESVRKIVAYFIISLPPNKLNFLLEDPSLLIEKLIPVLHQASFFSITKNSYGFYCAHGNQIATFIENLIKCTNENNAQKFISLLLDYLIQARFSYDPGRIYTLIGLTNGLKNKFILQENHLTLIDTLTNIPCEGDIRTQLSQILCQRLLYNADLQSVSLRKYIEHLAKLFLKTSNFTEYEWSYISQTCSNYLKELQDLCKTYMDISFKECDKLYTAEFSVIYNLLFILDSPNKANLLLTDILEEYYKYDYKSDSYIWISQLCSNLNISSPFEQLFVDAIKFYKNEKDDSKFIVLQHTPDVILKQLKKQIDLSTVTNSAWNRILQSFNEEHSIDLVNLQISFLKIIYIFSSHIDEIDGNKKIMLLFKYAEEYFTRNSSSVNIHDNKEFVVVYNNYLHYAFEITALAINSGSEFSKNSFFDLLLISKKMLLNAQYHTKVSMFNTIYNILEYKFSEDVLDQLNLEEFVRYLWEATMENNMPSSERVLQNLFIQIIFHNKILRKSLNDKNFEDLIKEIISIFTKQGVRRRCILPMLSNHLCSLFHYSDLAFKIEWLPSVLMNVYTTSHDLISMFIIEEVMAKISESYFEKNLYQDIYGDDELIYRGYILYILGSLDFSNISQSQFAKNCIDFIEKDPKIDLYNPLQGNSENERLRISAFQIILTLEKVISTEETAFEYVTKFLKCLETEPSPSVRLYIEWIVVMILIRFEQYQYLIYKELNKSEAVPKYIGSLEIIGLLLVRQKKLSEQDDAYERYCEAIIPFAISNRAAVRHSTVTLLSAIFPDAKKKNLPKTSNNATLANIQRHIEAAPQYKLFRSGEKLLWDATKDYTLCGISGYVLNSTSDFEGEAISKEIFSIVSDKIQTLKIDMKLNIPIGDKILQKFEKPNSNDSNTKKQILNDDRTPLQTKSGAWDTVFVPESSNRQTRVKRGHLIIMGSLVDKAPNLGGICRLSDILGVELLTLNDISVVNTSAFKSVSVTAELWMPMKEVKEDNIIKYIKEKSTEGYTLIGLEQTDSSIQLDNKLKFPEKTVLILGKEREGIPANILAELDFCVEIRQVGVVRSMNIQTATAVVAHTYTMQHL